MFFYAMKQMRLLFFIVVLLLPTLHCQAGISDSSAAGTKGSPIFVSPEGNDNNDGSMNNPLRTIGKAASLIGPGDICYIREGHYHESIHLSRSGEPGNPIQFKAYQNETVVIDGTDTLDLEWTLHKGNIYKTHVITTFNQLFLDTTFLVPARWPNMKFPDELWKESRWASTGTGSAYGKVVDPELIGTGVDWTGAIAVLNVAHQFYTWTRFVQSYDGSTGEFTYLDDLGLDQTKEYDFHDDRYYLIGKLEALDYPGEWFLDEENDTLYVYTPSGDSPVNYAVRIKQRAFGITSTGISHVILDGLTFFGTSISLGGNSDRCVDLTVKNCEFIFSSSSEWIGLNNSNHPHYGESGHQPTIFGTNCLVENNYFAFGNLSGLEIIGSGNRIENNLIHDFSWQASLRHVPLRVNQSWKTDIDSCIIRQNTVYNAGGPLIHFNGENTRIEYNYIYSGMLARYGGSHDGSNLYTQRENAEGSVARYNWVNTSYAGTPGSWGGGIGIRGDDNTYGFTVHHNVIWSCGGSGILIKGNNHTVYNNTIYNIGGKWAETGNYISMPINHERGWYQENSYIFNNTARTLRYAYDEEADFPLTDQTANNFMEYTNVHELGLVDPDNHNYTPEPGSPLVNTGTDHFGHIISIYSVAGIPDIGAYESGDEKYWLPGYRYPHASFPIPAEKSNPDARFIDLIWREGCHAVSHDVYFGTSETAVENAGHESFEFKGNLNENMFKPGQLATGTHYFWRVDAISDSAVKKGTTWSFIPARDANPDLFSLSFMVYESSQNGAVIPASQATIFVNDQVMATDTSGNVNIFLHDQGMYVYQLSKKGSIVKTDSIHVTSDTLITDTLMHASYQVGFLIRDKNTDDPVEGCEVGFYGNLQQTTENGEAIFTDVPYGRYDISASAENYIILLLDDLEIYSDTLITLLIHREELTVTLLVTDKTDSKVVARAMVYLNSIQGFTNASGEINYPGLYAGMTSFTVEKDDYFLVEDSVLVVKDTTIAVQLIRERADIIFFLTDGSTDIKNASILIDGFTQVTSSSGIAIFSNMPARNYYTYEITKEGFQPQQDSLYLETDTILNLNIIPVSLNDLAESTLQFYPNPVGDYLIVESENKIDRLRIYSILGEAIIEIEAEQDHFRINTSGLPHGIYLLEVIWKDEGRERFHLVK